MAITPAHADGARHGDAHDDDDHDDGRSDHDFSIRTLSNRADLISGGDALVEV